MSVHSICRSTGPKEELHCLQSLLLTLAEARPGRAVPEMPVLKEVALFALGTGCRSSLHGSESLTLCPGWGSVAWGVGEGIWPASGEVVPLWFEPGMPSSSNRLQSAHSGSSAASSFPRLSRVTQSSIQTNI